ncbi:MAG: HEPN domain-containing protein [Phycisphaerae bacterium]|nr:HEPN domain-containing protein [Phycisphaerae bacterium]
MKPITAEWVARTESDFGTAQRESRVRKNPNYDGICFHYQQRAEKYLKARLSEAGISFGKIHDLVAILEQVVKVEPDWEIFRQDLAYLSDFAAAFRYPGESADKKAAAEAKRLCTFFRKIARSSLGLRT